MAPPSRTHQEISGALFAQLYNFLDGKKCRVYAAPFAVRLFERDGEDVLLTNSMINNYVKNGVLPHPEKKKYSRQHLAALMAICMLKQVLTIPDIATLLDGQELDPELYAAFLQAHTGAVREACRDLEESCRSGQDLRREALRLAAQANAKRAAAARILRELAQEPEKQDGKE